MKESISKLGTDSQNEIITLNSKIMGWSNYDRTCVAKAVFSGVDNVVYWQLSEWVKRSSRGRSLKKKMRKYYKVGGSRKGVFTTKAGKTLLRHDATKIVRHIRVSPETKPL